MSTNDLGIPGFVPLTATQQRVSDGLHARRWQVWQQQQWLRTHYNVGRCGALSEAQAGAALARLAGLDAKDRHDAAAAARTAGRGPGPR